MIAHFALMGSLYQHNPYETKASLWNTYPWQIGVENEINVLSNLPEFSMGKTIWDIDNDYIDGAVPGGISANLGNFSMFATLIVMDQWGNFGSDVGKDPEIITDKIFFTGGAINSISSELILISSSMDDTQNRLSFSGGAINSISSELILISSSMDDTQNKLSFSGGAINSISSTAV